MFDRIATILFAFFFVLLYATTHPNDGVTLWLV